MKAKGEEMQSAARVSKLLQKAHASTRHTLPNMTACNSIMQRGLSKRPSLPESLMVHTVCHMACTGPNDLCAIATNREILRKPGQSIFRWRSEACVRTPLSSGQSVFVRSRLIGRTGRGGNNGSDSGGAEHGYRIV